MSRRTIVIGDVHGCLDELKGLLAAVEASSHDRLISVGDLVCKGPYSRGVLDWTLAQPNLEIVLGNHELRLLERWRRGERSREKAYDAAVYEQLGADLDRYMGFVSSWPLTLRGEGFRVVHAGFDPRRAPEGQDPAVLTGLRRLADGRPWFDAYEGKDLVVFGHWAQRLPVLRPNAVGLDTGCVYGGALSALILPERRLVSVPARRAYAAKKGWDDVRPHPLLEAA